MSFTYNADETLATKTDAKSNQTQYTYDSYRELTQVARGSWNAGTSTFTEDVSQRVTYTYGGTNPLGARAAELLAEHGGAGVADRLLGTAQHLFFGVVQLHGSGQCIGEAADAD